MLTRTTLWAHLAVIAALLTLACGGAQAPAEATAETAATPHAAHGDLSAFRTPRPGLWSGGQPDGAQLRAFAAQGGKLVISLLTTEENASESQQAAALGLTFVAIPVGGADDLTEDNARRLGETFAAHPGAPTLLHCASGNRSGALLALEAFYVEGQSATAALELGKRAGLTRLEDKVRELLQAACASTPERC